MVWKVMYFVVVIASSLALIFSLQEIKRKEAKRQGKKGIEEIGKEIWF
jgi:hypothetical protein